MKRVIFTIIAALAFVGTQAADLKLTSGTTAALKDDATAVFVLDLTGTRWEEDDDFKEWCGKDYQIRIDKATNGFVDGFNDSSKHLRISLDSNAKYTIKIKVDNFVQRCPGIPCYIKIFGNLSLIDNTTGEELCKIQIDGISGRSDYSPDDRFRRSFDKLAKTVVKQFAK